MRTERSLTTKSRFLQGLGFAVAVIVALSACTSSTPEASQPTPAPTSPPATSTATPEPSTATPAPAPTNTSTPSDPSPETAERIEQALAIAAYVPFNVDGVEGITPSFFGDDDEAQELGYQCYLGEVAMIDTASVRQQAAETDGWLELTADEARAARQAVASCVSADTYRAQWIETQVWGWNNYARNTVTQAPLSADDPCFSPIFESAEAFVAEVVEIIYFPITDSREAFIGPFDCRASAGLPHPLPVSERPVHPWYECEVFQHALIGVDYKVINIAADDPDGGLVAHVTPGVDTAVTEILPDGTGELRLTACQENLNIDSVWWLVEDRGWVNASYLQAHSPFGPENWVPGMTDPIDSANLPDVIGLEGQDLADLAEAVRSAVAVEDFTQVQLGNFMGVDARGGIARLDIVGLGDDSVNGYRMKVTIEFIKDVTATDILGYRIVSATGSAICSRGVSADGNLCV